MTVDTTDPTSILIIKYEVFNKKKTHTKYDELDADPIGILYEDETWKTCFKSIHPTWLLVYRLFAFGVMLALFIANVVIDGTDVLFFYTQWTFALVAFYFGLASSHSIYGCYQYWNGIDDDNIDNAIIDHERGAYMPINPPSRVRKTAGVWGYFFQIVFQGTI
ncbi:uncharacterized protein LOC143630423 [Bidens hawaiensis]|uniref:uncharacterized protein LOC143630423 n=1 Tax=Bidens hawaiensis TaxID=980011 RepID=UPI00404ABC12